MITALSLVMTINVTFASSAPSSAGPTIAEHFHERTEYGYLVTSVFLCGYVIGPSFWGPASEVFGRRPLFLVTLACYTIFHLGQALAKDMNTLLATRFLSGFFAVSPLTNCGGLIFDIWDPITRGIATSLFVAGVFVGPVLGPIVGGFLTTSYLGWRWVFWIMMIFAGSCTVVASIFVPETYAPVLLQKKAQRLRKADPIGNANLYAEHEKADWSIKGVLHRTLYRPIHMLAIEPILLLVTIYLSLVYGVLYALFEALPVIFVGTRGFTIGESGLVFIGVGIGTTIGAATFLPLTRHYPELMKKWHGFPPPEQRLFGAMLGGITLVIGCFWLGWTGNYPSVPWIVPALGTIPIGASVSMVFISFLTYLVDTYLMYTASAFAASTMVRSAVGAAFPLFTTQMFENLGINWACTLIGLLGLLLAPSPFLFYRYGAYIRSKSKFSPSPDLLIAEKIKAEEAAIASISKEEV
ncbi:MFS general substrate transporter [Wolfiporia cocos MD-104 SS10]|uniref:MFS general substrate transporter n=1 Tax=Wolfiporia cocos (strain MD-104) TaxID=742152 RepID=A0A2H3JBG3_WOLCO|nr:MFS general substrate transporter [Wolfiporia cocos MD-104 SS10]